MGSLCSICFDENSNAVKDERIVRYVEPTVVAAGTTSGNSSAPSISPPAVAVASASDQTSPSVRTRTLAAAVEDDRAPFATLAAWRAVSDLNVSTCPLRCRFHHAELGSTFVVRVQPGAKPRDIPCGELYHACPVHGCIPFRHNELMPCRQPQPRMRSTSPPRNDPGAQKESTPPDVSEPPSQVMGMFSRGTTAMTVGVGGVGGTGILFPSPPLQPVSQHPSRPPSRPPSQSVIADGNSPKKKHESDILRNQSESWAPSLTAAATAATIPALTATFVLPILHIPTSSASHHPD